MLLLDTDFKMSNQSLLCQFPSRRCIRNFLARILCRKFTIPCRIWWAAWIWLWSIRRWGSNLPPKKTQRKKGISFNIRQYRLESSMVWVLYIFSLFSGRKCWLCQWLSFSWEDIRPSYIKLYLLASFNWDNVVVVLDSYKFQGTQVWLRGYAKERHNHTQP